MLPLASWLDCVWRHSKPEGYGTIIAAAQKLDAHIWDRHKIKLLYCDDPWRFRDISTAEVERAKRWDMSLGDADYPQLGTHADPTCRLLTGLGDGTFHALIGTRTDRPLPLLTMNTAALYEPSFHGDCITNLFASRRLWSDHPERDCADLQITTQHVDRAMITRLPAVFLGTAWTRQDRRGRGVMTDVSRLHRMVAWLRWPIPQFATVVPKAGSEKVFGGTDIGAVIEKRPHSTIETRVLYWSPDDIVTDASRINATPPT